MLCNVLLTLILSSSFKTCFAIPANISYTILQRILENYDLNTRPVRDLNDTLTVDVGMSIFQLLEVDEKRQTISINILFRLQWHDILVKDGWEKVETEFNGSIRITPNKIWRPDIYLYNTAQESTGVFHDAGNVFALLHRDGTVLHVPPILLKANCKMDITFFPFDTQICPLKLGSWTHNQKEIDLVVPRGKVDQDNFIENGEWSLTSTTWERDILYYVGVEDPYVSVTFKLIIKRKSLYYLFNLIVPCALIGFLAILGFTLPPDSGDKLNLGVTVLFSLIVFLNMVSSSMPANSDSIPLLGTYFCCVMVMIASSVISTIVINLNLKGIATTPKKMEGWSRKIFLGILPRLTGMTRKGNGSKIWNSENTENFEKSDFEDEWRFAAFVVDRFCLIVSLIVTLIFFSALFISGFLM